MNKVNVKDRFERIQDYVSASDITSKLHAFLGDEDLFDFCDYLVEEFGIDIDEDEYFDEDDNFED